MTAPNATDRVRVARQPVFDRADRLVGYELLHRPAPGGRVPDAPAHDDDKRTQQVLAHSLVALDLDDLVEGRDLYVHVTPRFLHDEWHRLLPPGRTILQLVGIDVARSAVVDHDVVAVVRAATQAGYTVAIDHPIDEPLGGLADEVGLIEVDVGRCSDDRLVEVIGEIRGRGVPALAEKVESHRAHRLCHGLGFERFQGYFFQRPEVVGGPQLRPRTDSVLDLLAAIESPAASFDELARIIESDATLTFKLLRLANSAHFCLQRRVESVHQCVQLVGFDTTRKMALLLALSATADKPSELTRTVLVRAKLCELLATSRPHTGFATGLLSLLHAVIDLPKEETISRLPMTQEISDAVLGEHGELGMVLRAARLYERGSFDAFDRIGIPSETASRSYRDAVRWARDLMAAIAP